MASKQTLAGLRSALPQFDIENEPYDVGYWLRVASSPRPRSNAQRDGWDVADRELKAERITQGADAAGGAA